MQPDLVPIESAAPLPGADPEAIVAAPGLSLAEKRAILAEWASDAHAVESDPALRRPPGCAAPVSIDAILAALHRLDRPGAPPRPGAPARRGGSGRRLH
ncbi:conserved hypothetical protein [Methylobacterium sp. 4-46]|uniref:hypothetical protein n=1 Tax=unclassified Methylobacterium TaxID=2615210 RepID=UPI000152D334|nr:MULTISPECIES: hypothetical protein [Methylobacterium]ACA16956.1 conserved hypothetical protein [Methylobacterium sp. 4-46]WFT82642.1 hypothetical protein QA634_12675 [Methylobacterium nodulans]